MGKHLAEAFRVLHSRVPGSELTSESGIGTFTVSRKQLEEAFADDPVWQALNEIDAMYRPCATCTTNKDWWCGRSEFGVCSSLPDDDGACGHCHAVTTEEDQERLRGEIADGRAERTIASEKQSTVPE